MNFDEDTRPCVFGRSSHRSCSIGKDVYRNFVKFTGKHLCQGLSFKKGAGLRSATLLKKRLWYRCFPANFVKFLRTPFFTEHLRWLLLAICICQAVLLCQLPFKKRKNHKTWVKDWLRRRETPGAYNRRGYSVSKRLVKLTRFKNFPLELSGHQDIPPLSFALGHQL